MFLSRRIRFIVFAPFFVVVLLTFVAVGVYTFRELRSYQLEDMREQLVREVQLLSLTAELQDRAPSETNAVLTEAASRLHSRVTVIEPDGRVSFDSQVLASDLRNHGDRPEFLEAMRDEVGVARRVSDSVKTELMYVAVPVRVDGRLVRVARLSRNIGEAQIPTRRLLGSLVVGGGVLLLVSLLAGFLVLRHIVFPLEELQKKAQDFSNGDLSDRLPLKGSREIRELSEAMNAMAGSLQKRFQTITRQRSELEAVLANMNEAVLVLRPDGTLIRANHAAQVLLAMPEGLKVKRRTVEEVTTFSQIQAFVAQACRHRGALETEMAVGDRFLQAHSTRIQESEEDQRVLVVLHDITRLKKLESLRKDFVANVSHELKTPITSIRGFVETLREGAISEPESCNRFLEIIARQSERLHRIVEDLLSLSRLEQYSESESILLKSDSVKDVLRGAFLSCEPMAREHGVTLRVDCPDDLVASINAPLLEQAVVNLVDNAIKHSPSDSEIVLSGSADAGQVTIAVVDPGSGIPAEHLSRIFERFYRVDKARSRVQGGTGLGLSIVKHIVQSHGGVVAVESTVRKGSTFTIRLPVA